MDERAARPWAGSLGVAAAVLLLAAVPSAHTTGRVEASRLVLVLKGATVIDGTGGQPRAGISIIVQNGRIAAIADGGDPVPDGATVMDLHGRYVLPGLIDTHVHLALERRADDDALVALLLSGVTSIRDMGGDSNHLAPLAVESESPTVPTPRVRFLAAVEASQVLGEPSWGANGSRPAIGVYRWLEPIARRTDLADLLIALRKSGAAGVKFYTDVPLDVIHRAVNAAHSLGLITWAHAFTYPNRPGELLRTEIDGVSHAGQLAAEAASGVRLSDTRTISVDSPVVERLLDLIQSRDILFEPTLAVSLDQARRGSAATLSPARASAFRWACEATARARRRGIVITAGSDWQFPERPGLTLHAELEALVGCAGLTPLEAIVAATRNAARALGMSDSVGTIKPGEIADLVVVRADPTREIGNLRRVEFVMKAGRIYRPGPISASARQP